MSTYRIALIPGDGIGKEVVPEGVRVLEAAGRKTGVSFQWTHFDWSCETYHQTGRMMPPDGLLYLGGAETVLGITGRFAPVTEVRLPGNPESVRCASQAKAAASTQSGCNPKDCVVVTTVLSI